jgi:pyruvate,water dikinase
MKITGLGASKGSHVGKARVCATAKQAMSKIKDGDVLVTSMTDPDFVPAMILAGAFVTANGGVTCHAAIVARELGKPCVVGVGAGLAEIIAGGTITVRVEGREGEVTDGGV